MITSSKFEIIHNASCRDNNALSIAKMCELASVSRSGYYEWLAAEPYRQMAKALKTNTIFPNEVDQKFLAGGVRKVLLTYIFYGTGVCYLSTILDAFTREILGH